MIMKATEVVNEFIQNNKTKSVTEICDLIKSELGLLVDLSFIESELGWISVEERLPENFQQVLVLNSSGEHFCTFDVHGLYFRIEHYPDRLTHHHFLNVTHWKPSVNYIETKTGNRAKLNI